jgi:hypothetical protein
MLFRQTALRYGEIWEKYLPLGWLLSGFVGGLSGHQGALRSAFLIKADLREEIFIRTGTVSAVIADIIRLGVHGADFYTARFVSINPLFSGMIAVQIVT